MNNLSIPQIAARSNTQADLPRDMPALIEVTNLRPGHGSLLLVFDLRVGDILIFDMTMRQGRGQATYINFPSKRVGGVWRPMAKVLAPDLLDAVRTAVLLSVRLDEYGNVKGGSPGANSGSLEFAEGLSEAKPLTGNTPNKLSRVCAPTGGADLPSGKRVVGGNHA